MRLGVQDGRLDRAFEPEANLRIALEFRRTIVTYRGRQTLLRRPTTL